MLNLLDSALAAAAEGLRVFPLRQVSDQPAIDNWMEAATTDEEAIRGWWGNWPNANVGIALGAGSDTFVVRLRGRAALDWWRSEGLPDGAVVSWPDGAVDRFFRLGALVVPTEGLQTGLSIECEGDYTVGPGSILSGGTVRGDLRFITSGGFDPAADLNDQTTRRFLPVVSIRSSIREVNNSLAVFMGLVTRVPLNDERAVDRARLLNDCLRAGFPLREAASIVWRSPLGERLHADQDGAERLWSEARDAVASDRWRVPEPRASIVLIDEEERLEVGRAWWGSGYVDWATEMAPDAAPVHRLNRWSVIAHAFAGDAFALVDGARKSLDLAAVVVGGGFATLDQANSVMRLVTGARVGPSVPSRSAEPRYAPTMEAAAPRAHGVLASALWVVLDDAVASTSVDVSSEAERASGSRPIRLASKLSDGRDALIAKLGPPPFDIGMDAAASHRHRLFTEALADVVVDPHDLQEFALTVRKCAVMAALAEGASEVQLRHELIAIEQGEEWLVGLAETRRGRESFAPSMSMRMNRYGNQLQVWPVAT